MYLTMVDLFFLKLILSFLTGAIWITTTTYLAERFGAKIGGVITGIPSTVVLALFFIGWTQSVHSSFDASSISPAMMGLADVFTAVYILCAAYPLGIATGAALFFWFILSYLLVLSPFHSFFSSLMIFALLFPLCVIVTKKQTRIPPQSPKRNPLTYNTIAIRAMVSGTIIALSVIMSKIGSPLLGGVFASFPAVMLATILITQPAQGKIFTTTLLRTLMISASINVTIYIVALRLLYPSLGLIPGTLVAYMIALGTSYLTYQWMRNNRE